MISIWWGKSSQKKLKSKNSEEEGEKPNKKAQIRKSIFFAIGKGGQKRFKDQTYTNSKQS